MSADGTETLANYGRKELHHEYLEKHLNNS